MYYRKNFWQSKLRTRLAAQLSRRAFIGRSAAAMGLVAGGSALSACGSGSNSPQSGGSGSATPAQPLGTGALNDFGPLVEQNGVMVPAGFTVKQIARANQNVGDTSFAWHTDPDGAATYETDDGGWIYVSNIEFAPGGVNAIRFDSQGDIVNAFPLLDGTIINCGGGVTPWGSWVSCEETVEGFCWECDPYDESPNSVGTRLDLLGKFNHEAIAVDPRTNIVYLTEDQGDGLFYRFIPNTPNVGGRPDFTSGTLQAMFVHTDPANLVDDSSNTARGPWTVSWQDVPVPNPAVSASGEGMDELQDEGLDLSALPADNQSRPTRYQDYGDGVEVTPFEGGEGIWFQDGVIYFATKGDWRVWAHDIDAGSVEIIYYAKNLPEEERVLTNVDNIVMTPGGDIIVVEDGGNMEANAIRPNGEVVTLVRVLNQDDSEVTGPAFSPDGKHFYFSSQRGFADGPGMDGITYCVSGEWFTPA